MGQRSNAAHSNAIPAPSDQYCAGPWDSGSMRTYNGRRLLLLQRRDVRSCEAKAAMMDSLATMNLLR